MPKLPKFNVQYVVLHQVKETPVTCGYESTYFATHGAAFLYCDGHPSTVKAVYVVKGRNPLTLGPVNVFGSITFGGATCPVFQMEQHFQGPAHNINFVIV